MAKTNAEICKDYYRRNQAEKRKKSAERVRAHRLRKKVISERRGRLQCGPSSVTLSLNMCMGAPGPSRQPAPISLNEINPDDIVNQVDDKVGQSSWSTSAPEHRDVIPVQAKEHFKMPLVTIKTERDVGDAVVVQGLDSEPVCLWDSSLADCSSVVQEVDTGFGTEIDHETGEIMIKQELDIGPTVLQPRMEPRPRRLQSLAGHGPSQGSPRPGAGTDCGGCAVTAPLYAS